MSGKVHGARRSASAARPVREIGQRADASVSATSQVGTTHRALTLEDGSLGGDRELPEGADSAGPRAQRMGAVGHGAATVSSDRDGAAAARLISCWPSTIS